jgi:hypothetical protein
MIPVVATIVYAVAKKAIPILRWLRNLIFGIGRGEFSTAFRSTFFGIVLSVIIFLGGFAFLIVFGFRFSIEKFAFLVDIVMSPFSWLVSSTLSYAMIGGCPPMPSTFTAFLSVLHLNIFIGVVVSSICAEVFLRFFIRMFIKDKVV